MSSSINNNNNDSIKPKVEILKNEDKLMALIDDRNNNKHIGSNKTLAESVGSKGRNFKEHDIFIGNLSLYTTEETLSKFFSDFGAVANTRIMHHPDTKKSRRFGFVTFADRQSVVKVLSRKNLVLDGMEVQIRLAHKRLDEEVESQFQEKPSEIVTEPVTGEGNKIFVGGIGQDITYEKLREYFAKFGTLTDCKLPPDESPGRHKGFAFLTYKSPIDAKAAFKDRYHKLGKKTVEVKIATPQKRFQDIKASSEHGEPALSFGDQTRPFSSLADPLILPPSFNQEASFSGPIRSYPSQVSSFRYAPYTLAQPPPPPTQLHSPMTYMQHGFAQTPIAPPYYLQPPIFGSGYPATSFYRPAYQTYMQQVNATPGQPAPVLGPGGVPNYVYYTAQQVYPTPARAEEYYK